jgi:hypothetical protein
MKEREEVMENPPRKEESLINISDRTGMYKRPTPTV